MDGDTTTLSRHARHFALEQVGTAGQRRIADGSALLIGVGGIGCAAASYLASSGVGHLLLCDFDTVDASNLDRQMLYGPDDIGNSKAECAASRLRRINPEVEITTIGRRLDDAELTTLVRDVDVVLDGCDNFATRFQVNDACVNAGRCLISGAAIRLEGQLAVFGPDYKTSSCYRCLYREADESLENCAGNGVLAPVPGVIGTMMAVETLKHLAGIQSPRGVLRLYEGVSGDSRSVTVAKRGDCSACGENSTAN
jgi:adenylyltransferase/sulfurtransferase